MNDIYLYHGSRGGIDGEIQPVSRERCDFGKGFYMGTVSMQTKGLVIEDAEPVFYTLEFKLSEIPENKILILNDDEKWLYTVLACRKKVSEFNELKLCKAILKDLKKYDVIIGAIADDKMNEAMKSFTNYSLTDKGLIHCLTSIKYGKQYVAKTEFACSKIKILDEHEIYGKEASDVRAYTYKKREESKDVVRSATSKYRGVGNYLDSIIKNEKQNEKKKEKGDGCRDDY